MVVKLCVMWVLLDFHLNLVKPKRLLSFSHSYPFCVFHSFRLFSPLSPLTVGCKLNDWPLHWQNLQLNHIHCSRLSSRPVDGPHCFAVSLFQSLTSSHVCTFFSTFYYRSLSSIQSEWSCFSGEVWPDRWGRHVLNRTESVCFFTATGKGYVFCLLCPSEWRSVGDWIQPAVSLWRCQGGWRTSCVVIQTSEPHWIKRRKKRTRVKGRERACYVCVTCTHIYFF